MPKARHKKNVDHETSRREPPLDRRPVDRRSNPRELNRKHSFEDVKKIVKLARAVGFNNINLDLIYGVPSQSENILKLDLKRLLALHPEHIFHLFAHRSSRDDFLLKRDS
jgi:oxygen-independent coproporphyrinogen-3 oxidase